MKRLILITLLFFENESFAATWKKLVGATGGGAAISCPANFVGVPKLYPYTVRDFCVMKYEAKNDGYGTAVSTAAGAPWAGIDRPTARSHCQALGPGYDMISNDQWQTIARNIADVASNWSTGTVASGELNRGHSDNAPASALVAVIDDNDPCNGTGQACTGTTWNSQRRTHTLSNGNKIWDLAGNVWEWVTNNSNVSNGTSDYISNMSGGDVRQTRYGAHGSTICATSTTSPYCGMGYGWFSYLAGAVYRGGWYNLTVYAGVFSASMDFSPTSTFANLGFRCVFVP